MMDFATLHYATITNANLSEADLLAASLKNANLHDANLFSTCLYNADCSYADMRNTYLDTAILCHANLTGAALNVKIVQVNHVESSDDSILYNIDNNIVQYESWHSKDRMKFQGGPLEAFKIYAMKESKKECLRLIPYLESLRNNTLE